LLDDEALEAASEDRDECDRNESDEVFLREFCQPSRQRVQFVLRGEVCPSGGRQDADRRESRREDVQSAVIGGNIWFRFGKPRIG
jgi:hypothetical protein